MMLGELPLKKKAKKNESTAKEEEQSILRSTCDPCSRLKRRCDGSKPVCDRCTPSEYECFYSVNFRMTSHKGGCSHQVASVLLGGDDEEGKKNKLACLSCRSRKRRCDQQIPSCSSCVRAGATCEYILPEKRKGARILRLNPQSSNKFGGLNDEEMEYLVIFLKTFEELIPALKWQMYADACFALAKEAEFKDSASSSNPTSSQSFSPSSTAAHRAVLWGAVGCGSALSGNIEKASAIYQQRVIKSLDAWSHLNTPREVVDIAHMHAFILFELIGDSVASSLQMATLKQKLDEGELIPGIAAVVKLWDMLGEELDPTGELARRVAGSGQEYYLTISEWKGYNLRVKNLAVGILHFRQQIALKQRSLKSSALHGGVHNSNDRDENAVRQMRKYLELAVECDGVEDSGKKGLSITVLYAHIVVAVIDFIYFPEHQRDAVTNLENLVVQIGDPALPTNELLVLVPIVWHQVDLLGFMLWLHQKVDAYHSLALIRNRFLPYMPGAKPLLPFAIMDWQGHSTKPGISTLMKMISVGFQAASHLHSTGFQASSPGLHMTHRSIQQQHNPATHQPHLLLQHLLLQQQRLHEQQIQTAQQHLLLQQLLMQQNLTLPQPPIMHANQPLSPLSTTQAQHEDYLPFNQQPRHSFSRLHGPAAPPAANQQAFPSTSAPPPQPQQPTFAQLLLLQTALGQRQPNLLQADEQPLLSQEPPPPPSVFLPPPPPPFEEQRGAVGPEGAQQDAGAAAFDQKQLIGALLQRLGGARMDTADK